MKFKIITQGCSFNYSDSEAIKGFLTEAGWEENENADLVIVNSCTVKGPTEQKFLKYLKKLNEENKKIIVTGCIAKANPKIINNASIIAPNFLNDIVQIAETTIKGKHITLLHDTKANRLNIPKIRINPIVEIIPISEGCLGACSYCQTKQARGNLISYDEKAIIKHCKKAIQEGVKELWITSQDNAVYGWDIDKKPHLLSLIKKINDLEGDFYIRIGMGNPDHFKLYPEQLIEMLKLKKVFKFLHIPVQSGNDTVLKNMLRNYTIKEFNELIKKIKKEIEFTLATDIIVGFPEETEQQFQDTINLVKNIKFDVINQSKFWKRPNTRAEKMKQLGTQIIKERSQKMTKVYQEISKKQNEKWIGKKCWILIDEKGKNNTSVGRNYYYKPIVVKKNYKLGTKLNVEIIDAKTHYLIGKVIKKYS